MGIPCILSSLNELAKKIVIVSIVSDYIFIENQIVNAI